MNYQQKIINYYDSSQWLYKLFCYDKNSLGMHFGFWDTNTKNRQAALVNQDQAIIDVGKIKKGQKILDAGCGVGGTAIHIAKKTAALVWGVTLSENQVDLAKDYALKKGVSKLTNFSRQSYYNTNFPKNYFDVIYGNESICYSTPKSRFLKEAYRILKPGGKIVIADGYTLRKPKNKAESKILNDFCINFALKELVTYKEMSQAIKSAGFVKINEIDKTKNVIPTAEEFYRKFVLIWPIIYIFSLLPFDKAKSAKANAISLINSKKGLDTGLFGYYIHIAEKPK